MNRIARTLIIASVAVIVLACLAAVVGCGPSVAAPQAQPVDEFQSAWLGPEYAEFKEWKAEKDANDAKAWEPFAIIVVGEIDGETHGATMFSLGNFAHKNTPQQIRVAESWAIAHATPGATVLAEQSVDGEFRFHWLAGGIDDGEIPEGLE
jgi:hypothetical protein